MILVAAELSIDLELLQVEKNVRGEAETNELLWWWKLIGKWKWEGQIRILSRDILAPRLYYPQQILTSLNS